MRIKRTKILVSAALGMTAMLMFGYWLNASPADAGIKSEVALRTVIVVVDGSLSTRPVVKDRQCGPSPQCRNGENGIDVVMLKSGEIPKQPVRAFVETDTDCTPDAYGISHCTNRLRLPDGRALEVRHDHNMHNYSCLSPGETVELQSDAFT